MNEKVESAPPKGLEEAPAAFRSPGTIEQPERPSWRPEDLPGKDLRGEDLTGIEGLLPEHLAGADLTGAKLPEDIAKFPALEQVKAISAEARRVFIGLLAACVYSWLVIGTTTDVALILNTASSPLPIINTPIPIAGFYVVGAALLAAVYGYFHFYLQRLWRMLASLPAVFRDGLPLDDRTDPWLLTNLVRADFTRLRQSTPPLTRLENLLTILLAWWLVPLTLIALWARYLPAHYWLGTTWLVALVGVTGLFGRHSYRLARATLRGDVRAAEEQRDDGRGMPARTWREFRQIRPDWPAIALMTLLAVCSLSAFRDNPRDDYTWLAQLLNKVGIRTFADLREVEVAVRPEGWDGQDWKGVKQVDLRGRNLAFADARRAFLANADLREANLTGATLSDAELQGVDLYDDDTRKGSQLRSADLRGARLQGGDLRSVQLQGAILRDAQLHGADLSFARLDGADLGAAHLRGAVLLHARLCGANLGEAQLQAANLLGAKLQGADLNFAQLEGADLRAAQLQGASFAVTRLQGADLRSTAMWRASFRNGRAIRLDLAGIARWDLADLRGTDVKQIADSEIDVLISEATNGILDDERQKAVRERLTERLRTANRQARPAFPTQWLSQPNVMFDQIDPKPQPLDWGPRKWPTEQDYDKDLANVLGDLACDRDVAQAQILGLARRSLNETKRLYAKRVAERLTGSDCPPAARLPGDIRRRLEELAGAAMERPAAAAPS